VTKREAIEAAAAWGISGAQLAAAWGHTRQWLYVERKTPLPKVYELALPETINQLSKGANHGNFHGL